MTVNGFIDPVLLNFMRQSIVDANNVKATALIFQVDLQGSGGWQVQQSSTAFTDVNGEVIWSLTCTASGNQPLSVVVAGTGYPLNLPACQEPAPQTFSSSPPDTSPSRNTTTTRF